MPRWSFEVQAQDPSPDSGSVRQPHASGRAKNTKKCEGRIQQASAWRSPQFGCSVDFVSPLDIPI